MIRDKQGNILVNKDVRTRYVENFVELLNRPEPERIANIKVIQDERPQEVVELPTRNEILKEIKDLKNNKAAGIDWVSEELMMHGELRLHSEL